MVRLGIQLNLVLLALVTVSMQIFNRVYRTSKQVIDEEFHLRQGLHYCRGNFTIWDPKITTFPGLYLVSALIFAPLKACSVYNLRLVSVIGSVLNALLIYKIREHVNKDARMAMFHWVLALESLTLTLIPPMYFFSFLYYTDILAITFVLAMIFFALKQHYFAASMFGFCSVLMRQTNVVWVGIVFCHIAITYIAARVMTTRFRIPCHDNTISHSLDASHRQKKVPEALRSEDLFKAALGLCSDLLKRPKHFIMDLKYVVQNLWGFLLVLGAFVVFIFANGSIVVGDKSAHEANFHLAQICYFSVFAAFFGPQNLLMNARSTLRQIFIYWKSTILLVSVLFLVVHFNTIVHPYLLADNRHFTFYVWNRFFGRHEFAKYLAIPVYVVTLTLLQQNLQRMNVSLSHLFVIGLFATIGVQRLIEVRYFLLPYLFLRLFSKEAKDKRYPVYLGLELLFYIIVNCGSFYMFFTKEIRWKDFADIQRIIW